MALFVSRIGRWLLPTVFAVVLCAKVSAAVEPRIEAIGPSEPCVAGHPCEGHIDLTFPESDGPVTLWAEEPEPVSWGTVALASVDATQTTDGIRYRQHIRVTPSEAGTFEVPSISFRVVDGTQSFPAEAQEPQDPEVSSALIPLRAPPFPLEVHSPNAPWAFAGTLSLVAAAVAILSGALYMRFRRSSQHGFSMGGETASGESGVLTAAKAHRLEGKLYDCYRALADAVPSDAGLVERLRRKAEDVGFRQAAIPPDEVDADFREVERSMARQKENKPQ